MADEQLMSRMNALNNGLKYLELRVQTKQAEKVSLTMLNALATKMLAFLAEGRPLSE